MVVTQTGEGAGRRPRLPGLDGLRALAVAAVFAYHLDVSWLPGGFLGVDVFLVVSGYLICWLLTAEWQRDGRISLRAFWVRRARRLLPALLVLLPLLAVAAVLTAPDAVARLRADALAALAYVSNWWQLAAGQSYVEDIGRPPLLRHLWSLALEEQFYVAFPPILLVGLRRGWSARRLAGFAVVLAGTSALAMALLFTPGADPSRVYYGTDTRSAGLFVGVALALLLPPGRLPVAGAGRRDLAGVASLGILAALMATLGDTSPSLYRGGLLAASAATGVVVVVVGAPGGRLGRVLGVAPLRWAGSRSYAIYLWHWPVVVLTRPQVDVPVEGPALVVLRVGATLALAELSWQLVEHPFLSGAAGRWWRAAGPRRTAAACAFVGVAVLATGLVLGAREPGPPPLLEAALRQPAPPPTTLLASSPDDDPALLTLLAGEAAATPPPPPEPQLVVPDVSASPHDPFLAVGESVLLAARETLIRASSGAALVDAKVGRQVADGIRTLRTYRDRGDLAKFRSIVVHLGTNGRMSKAQFRQLVDVTEGIPRVIVVNTRVPQEWESDTNATIRDGVPTDPEMRLVDWYEASRPRGVLSYDGVHPTRDGAKVYARLILDQLLPKEPAPPPEATTTTMPPPPPPETTTTTTAPPAPPATEPTIVPPLPAGPPPESTTTAAPPPPA